jgi:hypothetical protein
MDDAEIEQPQQYPALALGDEQLLEEILSLLGKSVSSAADPSDLQVLAGSWQPP